MGIWLSDEPTVTQRQVDRGYPLLAHAGGVGGDERGAYMRRSPRATAVVSLDNADAVIDALPAEWEEPDRFTKHYFCLMPGLAAECRCIFEHDRAIVWRDGCAAPEHRDSCVQ